MEFTTMWSSFRKFQMLLIIAVKWGTKRAKENWLNIFCIDTLYNPTTWKEKGKREKVNIIDPHVLTSNEGQMNAGIE